MIMGGTHICPAWWLGRIISGFYGRGINYYNIDGKYNSQHAEISAVRHLPDTTKRTKVDVIVLRTNRRGNCLMMAKPCDNCLKYINKNITIKGYKLRRIYYTDEKGEFVKF